MDSTNHRHRHRIDSFLNAKKFKVDWQVGQMARVPKTWEEWTQSGLCFKGFDGKGRSSSVSAWAEISRKRREREKEKEEKEKEEKEKEIQKRVEDALKEKAKGGSEGDTWGVD